MVSQWAFLLWHLFTVSFAIDQVVMKTYSDDESGPLNEDFAKLVNKTLDLWHVPGLSIAVVDGEKTWSKVTRGLFALYFILQTR